MTTRWNKHSYICPTCDGSFEMTITEYRTIDQELCPSCFNTLVLLSVVDATITPTNEREKMETTTPQVMTLDWIENDVTTTKSYTESDIRHMVWQNKTLLKKQDEWYLKESKLRTFIHDVFENSDDQESLTEIAEMFDIPLTKEMEVTIWVRVDATVEVELSGGDSFEAVEQFVIDNLTVDSYGSEMSINNFDIDRVEEGAY